MSPAAIKGQKPARKVSKEPASPRPVALVSTCQHMSHLGLMVRDGAKRLLTMRVNFVPL